jgi:hydroxymethylbilane synthase
MSAPTLRIGTRASALALWQANRVADLIRAQPGAPAVELVHIKTEGDLRTDIPLWAAGGRAFFTREIWPGKSTSQCTHSRTSPR